MDKNTRKLTFSGLMAAGALAMLFLGRIFPTGQLGFAAVASVFVAAAVIDVGSVWGCGVWLSSSVLGLLLLSGSSSTWTFALFFGHYPIVKLASEKRLPKPGAWILKYLVFYIGFFAAIAIVGVAQSLIDGYGIWVIPVALVAGGGVFLLFDIGYSRLIEYYRLRLSRKR